MSVNGRYVCEENILCAPQQMVNIILPYFLGGLFIFTGAVKLQDIKLLSVNAVYEYGILPIEPVNLAAAFGYALPFLELFVGIALLLGVLTKLASLGGGLLGLSFSIGEAIVLLQGRKHRLWLFWWGDRHSCCPDFLFKPGYSYISYLDFNFTKCEILFC